MRLIYLLIIIVFALATLIFAVQNLAVVTVSFLTMNLAAPLALLVLVIYVLGAVTGSTPGAEREHEVLRGLRRVLIEVRLQENAASRSLREFG